MCVACSFQLHLWCAFARLVYMLNWATLFDVLSSQLNSSLNFPFCAFILITSFLIILVSFIPSPLVFPSLHLCYRCVVRFHLYTPTLGDELTIELGLREVVLSSRFRKINFDNFKNNGL